MAKSIWAGPTVLNVLRGKKREHKIGKVRKERWIWVDGGKRQYDQNPCYEILKELIKRRGKNPCLQKQKERK